VALVCQVLLAVLFLPLIGRPQRGIELLLLAMTTLLPVAAISAVWPAVGPAPAGEDFLPHALALRRSGPWTFDLSAMQGIVVIPSYHTVPAILFTYAFRGTGVMGWAIATLNAIMLPAIPPVGDHYLVDVVAGGGLAIFTIAVLRLGESMFAIRAGTHTQAA
jgi:hypothetical protein